MSGRQADGTRTALITGAAGGIGVALCDAFRSGGYRVIAVDRTFSADLVHTDGQTTQLSVDLSECCGDDIALARLVRTVREVIGRGGLHALVNNAAVQLLGSTEQLSVADWEVTLRTNVIAPFLLTQAFLSDLERAGGSVVNMASIHASLTKPGFVAYATSKSALVGLTRAMAVDLGSRVRVNAILPAAVATPMLLAGFEGRPDALRELGRMHPLNGVAAPADIASVALFLASSEAGFVSGASWHVDGAIGGRLHDPV